MIQFRWNCEMKAGGSRQPGARCLAMTEIKMGRTPCRVEAKRRRAHSALERLFSGIHFGMDN
jgi:hypothetical protein